MARMRVIRSRTRGSIMGAGVGTELLVAGVTMVVFGGPRLPRAKLNLRGSTRVTAWFTRARNIVSEMPCISSRENNIERGVPDNKPNAILGVRQGERLQCE